MTALIALTILATPFAIKAASNWSHNPARLHKLNHQRAIKAHARAVEAVRVRRSA